MLSLPSRVSETVYNSLELMQTQTQPPDLLDLLAGWGIPWL